MAKYDSTSIPLPESLAKLNVFLTRYSNYIQMHVPPTYFPQDNILVTAFKMRTSGKDDFGNLPLFILKTEMLTEPERVRTASRNYERYEVTENDVFARRWQAYVEHLVTFVVESPDELRKDAVYRHLGGYLATGNGVNLLDTMKAQLGKAMDQGKLPSRLSIWDDQFDHGHALGAGGEE